jgi:2-polyprenyl-6-methoxyphenol hydroxylase-like FAD-dependent oxidoreductase
MAAQKHVFVIGGGIGGCCAAIALVQAGAKVTIFEQAPELAEIGAGINVQAVAIGVLDDLGVSEEMLLDPVLGDGIRTSRVEYYSTDGVKIAHELVGRNKGDKYPQFSTHRAKFHNTLIAKARELVGADGIKLDHTFLGMDRNADGRVTAHFGSLVDKTKKVSATCDFLVGADGLKSPVRQCLLNDGLPQYTGRCIYRGLCEVDSLIGDGNTVSLCGNEGSNFICYPISDGMRKDGRTHCNWGFNVRRPAPTGVEDWTNLASVDEIREELAGMSSNVFGGLTPLQIAERSPKIIAWALFDREPLKSFDFGSVTLLGDAAHPLLPYGSQGATQAIMDAEALGVCFRKAMADGTGIQGAVKMYSDLRCEISGKVVLANRDMGSTAVLRVVEQKCEGMSRDQKAAWIQKNGQQLFEDVIKKYRESMPKSVRVTASSKL